MEHSTINERSARAETKNSCSSGSCQPRRRSQSPCPVPCQVKLEGSFKCSIANVCGSEWSLKKCIVSDCHDNGTTKCRENVSVCLYRGDAVEITYRLTPTRSNTGGLCFLTRLALVNSGRSRTEGLKVGVALQYQCHNGSCKTLGVFKGLESQHQVLEPHEPFQYSVAGCVDFPPSGTQLEDFLGDHPTCTLTLNTVGLVTACGESLDLCELLPVDNNCERGADTVFLHDSQFPQSPLEITIDTPIPIEYQVVYRTHDSDNDCDRNDPPRCDRKAINLAYLSNSCEPNTRVIPGTEVKTELKINCVDLEIKCDCCGSCCGGASWCLEKKLLEKSSGSSEGTSCGPEQIALGYQIEAEREEEKKRRLTLDLVASLACNASCKPKYTPEVCLKFKLDCAGNVEQGSFDRVVLGEHKRRFELELEHGDSQLDGKAHVKLCYKNQILVLATGCLRPLDDEVTCSKAHHRFQCTEEKQKAILTDKLSLPNGVRLVKVEYPARSPLSGLGPKLNGKVELCESICGRLTVILEAENKTQRLTCNHGGGDDCKAGPVVTNEAKLEFTVERSRRVVTAKTSDEVFLSGGSNPPPAHRRRRYESDSDSSDDEDRLKVSSRPQFQVRFVTQANPPQVAHQATPAPSQIDFQRLSVDSSNSNTNDNKNTTKYVKMQFNRR